MFSMAEAVELARVLRRLPPRLIIYGIEGESFEMAVGLSARVEWAVETVVTEVVNQLALAVPRMLPTWDADDEGGEYPARGR